MTSTVNYDLRESVATITLDDGKVNVLSPAMRQNINEALDRADRAATTGEVKAIVLAGNSRVLGAGFDLSVFTSGDAATDVGHAVRSIRVVDPAADVPGAGDHRGDRTGNRHGLVHVVER